MENWYFTVSEKRLYEEKLSIFSIWSFLGLAWNLTIREVINIKYWFHYGGIFERSLWSGVTGKIVV